VRKELGAGAEEKPCFFVFHGGSGSSEEEIKTAVGHGVVKMNVDTDTQWYVVTRFHVHCMRRCPVMRIVPLWLVVAALCCASDAHKLMSLQRNSVRTLSSRALNMGC
jgi:fructose/tagatose bisphosphate aldolase